METEPRGSEPPTPVVSVLQIAIEFRRPYDKTPVISLIYRDSVNLWVRIEIHQTLSIH